MIGLRGGLGSIWALALVAGISLTSQGAQGNSFGLRLNPLGLLVGVVDVSGDIAVHENVMVSVLGSFIRPGILNASTYDVSARSLGGAVTYHFGGAFKDSWYLGASYARLNVVVDNQTSRGEVDLDLLGPTGGYMWAWTSFYLNLGMTFYSAPSTDVRVLDKTSGAHTDSERMPSLAAAGIDFKIGWFF